MKFASNLFVVLLSLFHIAFGLKVLETKIDRLNRNLETVERLAREKRVEQDVEKRDARVLTKRNGRYTLLHFLIGIFLILKILKKLL